MELAKTQCTICESEKLTEILELGNFPPANFLTKYENDSVEKLNLTLMSCDFCGHLQQKYFFQPEKLFNNYLYQSGTSKTLDDFFHEIAEITTKSLDRGSDILELACNDGTFLEKLSDKGFNVVGVDPAKNILEYAIKRGLKVFQGYWPINLNKKFDAIYAFNVLAHVTNPISFFEGALSHLKDTGYLAIQTSQIRMIENAEFDTIYHEHYSFFTKSSLNYLAIKYKLNISIFETSVHGGSALAIFTKNNNTTCILQSIRDEIGVNFIKNEFLHLSKKHEANDLNIFKEKCYNFKSRINNIISEQINKGRKIVFVGAAAKTVTVLFYSNVNVDYIVDEAPLKVNKFIPVTNIKISPFNAVSLIEEDCFFIIGAWNFYEELKSKIYKIRSMNNSKDVYFTYFPQERFD